MSRIEVLPGLCSRIYSRHCLHHEDRTWVEKNCYSDLWIELLHSLDLEPLALFSFVHAVDFEGDQWTFFKPPLEFLRCLYGINVQELTVWRPLIEHAVEHLGNGKLISTEADAYWLPDTSGTDYRHTHTKTTIVLANVDVQNQWLGYFHNTGYFELSGEDFRKLFRLDAGPDTEFLPLFAELVRIDRLVKQPKIKLAEHSLQLLRLHFGRRPLKNPFVGFSLRLAEDLPKLQIRGLPYYHAWAFASIRQVGAAFELASANLRWLASCGQPGLEAPARSFDIISATSKALILKGARAVNAKRALESADMLKQLAQAWDEGMGMLEQYLNQPTLQPSR